MAVGEIVTIFYFYVEQSDKVKFHLKSHSHFQTTFIFKDKNCFRVLLTINGRLITPSLRYWISRIVHPWDSALIWCSLGKCVITSPSVSVNIKSCQLSPRCHSTVMQSSDLYWYWQYSFVYKLLYWQGILNVNEKGYHEIFKWLPVSLSFCQYFSFNRRRWSLMTKMWFKFKISSVLILK